MDGGGVVCHVLLQRSLPPAINAAQAGLQLIDVQHGQVELVEIAVVAFVSSSSVGQ